MSFDIHDWPLPYVEKLELRARDNVDLVVVHCTELPTLALAREYGERVLYDAGTGNSGHYYIDRDGSVHRFVSNERIANHTRGFNPRSIGIELVNRGRYPDWYHSQHQAMTEPYSEEQMSALLKLLDLLRRDLPKLTRIAGHEDLDTAKVSASDDPSIQISRKRDPGPMFDWQRVLLGSGLVRGVG